MSRSRLPEDLFAMSDDTLRALAEDRTARPSLRFAAERELRQRGAIVDQDVDDLEDVPEQALRALYREGSPAARRELDRRAARRARAPPRGRRTWYDWRARQAGGD